MEIIYDGTNMPAIREWGATSHHDRVQTVNGWVTLEAGDRLKATKPDKFHCNVIVLNHKGRPKK
jgi:hypothetical protein